MQTSKQTDVSSDFSSNLRNINTTVVLALQARQLLHFSDPMQTITDFNLHVQTSIQFSVFDPYARSDLRRLFQWPVTIINTSQTCPRQVDNLVSSRITAPFALLR
jgi:hypothetical protein